MLSIEAPVGCKNPKEAICRGQMGVDSVGAADSSAVSLRLFERDNEFSELPIVAQF